MSTARSRGSLVNARGREWVVLPDSDAPTCWCCARSAAPTTRSPASSPTWSRSPSRRSRRPIPTTSATPPAPAAARPRCGSGSAPAPGRSARWRSIAVEPRAYQLVPLLMALRQDTVRLLICRRRRHRQDHRGRADRRRAARPGRAPAARRALLARPGRAVAGELRDQVRHRRRARAASTVPRLERGLALGESLFERHPIRGRLDRLHQVAQRHRDDFVARTAPTW